MSEDKTNATDMQGRRVDVTEYIGQRRPCILCGKDGRIVSLFIPDQPWYYVSAPPRSESTRVFFYALCGKHRGQAERSIELTGKLSNLFFERVEAAIKRINGMP